MMGGTAWSLSTTPHRPHVRVLHELIEQADRLCMHVQAKLEAKEQAHFKKKGISFEGKHSQHLICHQLWPTDNRTFCT